MCQQRTLSMGHCVSFFQCVNKQLQWVSAVVVMVVVWSLPCNSQSLSISLPQPPRSLLPAFMGSLRICGKGTLIARGLRSSENGEKEVIACPRSIHHPVKSPALLDTIRSVVPFPSYLAISLTHEYDLDREMLIYMCVALGRSKNCMWYQVCFA